MIEQRRSVEEGRKEGRKEGLNEGKGKGRMNEKKRNEWMMDE